MALVFCLFGYKVNFGQVYFTCEEGKWMPSENLKVECQRNIFFSNLKRFQKLLNQFKILKVLTCPRPILSESNWPLIIRTNISRDLVHFEKIDFDCPRSQYELIGDASITCLPDGTWSSSLPSCKSKYSLVIFKEAFLNCILLFLLLLF